MHSSAKQVENLLKSSQQCIVSRTIDLTMHAPDGDQWDKSNRKGQNLDAQEKITVLLL